jgi:hypothetical protein
MGSKTRKAQCTTLYVCDSNREKCSKSFDRSWAYFLARFWGFEGYEHGPRTNTRWMTSSHWLFENLDCSREFLRLRLPLGWQKGNWCYKVVVIHGKGPIWQRFPIDHYKERKANDRVHDLLYERWLQVGTSRNNLAHTFTYFANFEVLTTRCFESAIPFKVDAMHMLARYGAHDAC